MRISLCQFGLHQEVYKLYGGKNHVSAFLCLSVLLPSHKQVMLNKYTQKGWVYLWRQIPVNSGGDYRHKVTSDNYMGKET